MEPDFTAEEIAQMEAEEAADRQWREQVAAAQREWLEKWPNHCKDCGGWGGASFWQSHPYGMGSAYEQMYDPCECTMEGRCSRCGVKGLTDEGEGPCTSCGWNYDDGCPEA